MKAIKKLLFLIVVIVICVMIYRSHKPQIVGFLNDHGINVPGVTDDTGILPVTRTYTDENGVTSVFVTIPPTFTEGITQDELDSLVSSSEGRLAVMRESDGSLSLTMTPEYRDEILHEISSRYDALILDSLNGGNVIAINHSPDYSSFEVTCDPSISESEILTLTGKLFAVGKAYASLTGTENTVITVAIISQETGEVTNSYRSDNPAAGIASDVQEYTADLFDRAFTDMMDNVGLG